MIIPTRGAPGLLLALASYGFDLARGRMDRAAAKLRKASRRRQGSTARLRLEQSAVEDVEEAARFRALASEVKP